MQLLTDNDHKEHNKTYHNETLHTQKRNPFWNL